MDHSVEIIDYLDQQVLVLEHVEKVSAQAQMTLSNDFLDYRPETIHYYLWALCDSLEFIKIMLENLMTSFLQIKEKLKL